MRCLILFIVLISLMVKEGFSINCYQCVSTDNSDEACEKGWRSAGYARDCRTESGQAGQYCIKIHGQGAHTKDQVTIRACHISSWNMVSDDQPIQFGKYNVIGRVTSCDSNYCNSSSLPAPKLLLLLTMGALAFVISSRRKLAA